MSGNSPALSRRQAIVWAGTFAAALGGSYLVVNHGHPLGGSDNEGGTVGYGSDPNLVDPAKALWPRLMTADQLAMTKAIADFILPADGLAPSASAIGVHELVDEWISAPYPEQVADRSLVMAGLAWLDNEAKRHGARAFANATSQMREQALAALEQKSGAAPAGFYAKMRWLVIGGYYTSDAGFADIGYIGNQPMAVYQGASDDVRAALERAAQRLGLGALP